MGVLIFIFVALQIMVLGHVFSVAGWRCCAALRLSVACAWTLDYVASGTEEYIVVYLCVFGGVFKSVLILLLPSTLLCNKVTL